MTLKRIIVPHLHTKYGGILRHQTGKNICNTWRKIANMPNIQETF